MKNPNHGALTTSTSMITTSPAKNTAITGGRSRQPGRSVKPPSIHTAVSAHRARSAAGDVPCAHLIGTVTTARTASRVYGTTPVTTGRLRGTAPSMRAPSSLVSLPTT